MVDLQHDFYHCVSVKFGLARIGPRRQRLKREEWKATQRQVKLLADAHTRVDSIVAELKVNAIRHVQKRTMEADHAAQAKIDAVTTQARQNVSTLKREAILRIAALRDLTAKLENELSEKSAMIAEQPDKLEELMGVLRDNGLVPNGGI